MKALDIFKRTLYIFLTVLIAMTYYSCGEDETVTPPPNDTTVAIFNDLVISERTIPFDSALSGVDLNRGRIVLDGDFIKDANLVDSISLGDSSFYFRSGDLSDIPVPGYQARFSLISLISSQSIFDTMKVIPDSDTTLSENDFTMDNTLSFRAPLVFTSTYGFYLKGKFDNNVTPYRVFGIIYLDSSYYDATGFKLKFDVKINKSGLN
ncbi:MAG: hypothetical protein ACHQIH_00905, partial [Ignavibacteria bacterium]